MRRMTGSYQLLADERTDDPTAWPFLTRHHTMAAPDDGTGCTFYYRVPFALRDWEVVLNRFPSSITHFFGLVPVGIASYLPILRPNGRPAALY